MLFLFFSKYQVNLADEFDRNNFLKLFENLVEKEKKVAQNSNIQEKQNTNENRDKIILK